MATIVPTSMQAIGPIVATQTTLTASNTFSYEQGRGQILILRNPTASPINGVIDGADGTTVQIPGILPQDVSGGLPFTVANGAIVAIDLDRVRFYLQGVITMTGSGLTAVLLNP